MKKIFVLGPPDPEMEEIEKVVVQSGHQVAYASLFNRRVKSNEAYLSTGVLGQINPRTDEIIFVECSVMGLYPSCRMDHHSEGDPGYVCGPEDYFNGSSLGQVINYLGLEPTEEQRIIAAADHCPTQAYLGLCPGVDPEKLRMWRTATRAKRRKMSLEDMERAILEGKQILETARKIEYQGETFSWVDSRDFEVQEASARFNIPFMYQEPVEGGRDNPMQTKLGIMGGSPSSISAWMQDSQSFLKQVYGAPLRGYAGGYL